MGLYGLLQLQASRGNRDYDEFLLQWVKDNLAIGLPSVNINTTAPFLTLFDLTERYDLPEWEALCEERADYLVHVLPTTQMGGFEHITDMIADKLDAYSAKISHRLYHKRKDGMWEEEKTTRTLPESELPASIKRKLAQKRNEADITEEMELITGQTIS